jgi:hypothetical protein
MSDLLEFEDLLPFYVNGTLKDQDRARLEAELAISPALREALALEEQMGGRIKRATTQLLNDSETNLSRREEAMAQAIMATPQLEPSPKAEQGRIANALSFLNPRRWHPAVALTLLIALIAQAALIGLQASSMKALEKRNFELASGAEKPRDRSTGIMIEFNTRASWQEIFELLDAKGLTIVESGAFGVLTVSGDQKGEARLGLIQELRQSPFVSSAEPEA